MTEKAYMPFTLDLRGTGRWEEDMYRSLIFFCGSEQGLKEERR
jgi:hypothetical protein